MAVEQYKYLISVYDQASRQLGKIDKSAAKSDSAIKRLAARFGGPAGLATVATAAAGAFAYLSLEANKNLDNIAKTSRALGLTSNEYVAYSLNARDAGASQGEFEKSLVKLNRSIGEAYVGATTYIEAFRAIGVEYKDEEGNLRNTGEVFRDIADRLAETESATERAALSSRLLGRGFSKVTLSMLDGARGLEDAEKRAKALGVTFDEDLLDASEKVTSELEVMGTALDALFDKWQAGIAQTFVESGGARQTFGFFRWLGEMPGKLADGFAEGFGEFGGPEGRNLAERVLDGFAQGWRNATVATGQIQDDLETGFGGAADAAAAAIERAEKSRKDGGGASTGLPDTLQLKLGEQMKIYERYYSTLQLAAARASGDTDAIEKARIEQQTVNLETQLDTLRRYGASEVEIETKRKEALALIDATFEAERTEREAQAIEAATRHLASFEAKGDEARIHQQAARRMDAVDKRIEDLKAAGVEEIELFQQLADAKVSIEEDTETQIRQSRLGAARGFLNTLQSTLAQTDNLSKSQFEKQKKLSLALATIAAAETVIHAYNAGNRIGGPIVGSAFAATASKVQYDYLKSLKQAQFTGGAASGGSVAAADTPQPASVGATGTGGSHSVVINLEGRGRYSANDIVELLEDIQETTGIDLTIAQRAG